MAASDEFDMDRPEDGMWKLCPEAFDDCAECVESTDMWLPVMWVGSVGGKGSGPASADAGGGVKVCARGDAL